MSPGQLHAHHGFRHRLVGRQRSGESLFSQNKSNWLIPHLDLRLCSTHNLVNERLGKPEFDCANLDSEYDCGCGDDPVNIKKNPVVDDPMDLERDSSKDELTGVDLIPG